MLALPVLLALAAAEAPSPVAAPWAVVDGSTLSYHLTHKFHAVDGVTRAIEGRALLWPDGRLQLAVRARVAAFDSGNSNRDAHMMEVTDAARFPFVTVTGTAAGVRAGTFPAEVDVPITGTLDFHGVARPLAVTAHVRFEGPDRAEVTADFPVSLTEHGVERPSLLFVKVSDHLEIAARFHLRREGS